MADLNKARASWRTTCTTRLALLAFVLAFVAPLPGLSSESDEQRRNAPEKVDSPYLLIVSIDGFRWDYQDRHETPGMDRIAARGLRAEALQPLFPTLTFPNHFSIATGRIPDRHGIVANRFPNGDTSAWYDYKDRSSVQDGAWYRAEPVWVTAERHGMLSAAYYFVGTEADVGGIRPSRWNAFDPKVSASSRVDQVLEWLAAPSETRPHVITLYFEHVDDATHYHGPGSPESARAIEEVDSLLLRLIDGIDRLPHGPMVNLLLVSDHGMAAYDTERPVLVLDEFLDLEGVAAVEGGPYVHLHLEDPGRAGDLPAMRDEINARWNCGKAMLPGETPPGWLLGDAEGWPDLIVQAEVGCGVLSSMDKAHKMTRGDHGWPPEAREMRGIFLAMGPRIRAGSRTGIVSMPDIYPLMLELLGLPAPGEFEGRSGLLELLLH